MNARQLESLNGRLDAIDKIAGLLKWVVSGIIGAAVWATTLQIQVRENSRRLEEIATSTTMRVQDWSAWRNQINEANVKRDLAIAQLAQTLNADTAPATSPEPRAPRRTR